MSELNKVVWAEGVFLGQQHFQAWDRQLNSRFLFNLNAHMPFYWGLISMSWNIDALKEGRFEVLKLQCIMPNGMPVDYDREVDGSLSLELGDLNQRDLVLSLVIPQNDLVEGVAGYPNPNRIGGWKAHFTPMADESDATRTREVMLAKPNLMLSADSDSVGQMQSLRLIKIQRQLDTSFQVVNDILPACLSISALSFIGDHVKNTTNMLANMVRGFAENRVKIGDISSYSSTEMADFLYQKELVALLPEFKRLVQQTVAHPYDYYCSLVKLHQIVATYLQPESIDKVVEYNHDLLESCLTVLSSEIRDMASLKKDRPESQVQLNAVFPGRYETTEVSRHTLENFSFYLAVDAKQDSVEWITRFVNMSKLGSVEQLDTMMASGIPGVPLRHVQRLPQKIRIKSGYEYFQIQTEHELWNYILQSQKFGLYCMGEFADANVELIVLDEK